MICDACQTRNNYYHKFCYHCGASLNVPDELKDGLPPVQEEEMESRQNDLLAESQKKPKRNRLLLMLAVIVVILMVVAIFIGVSLSRIRSNELQAMLQGSKKSVTVVPSPSVMVASVEKQKPTLSPVPTATLQVIPATLNILEPSSLSARTETGIYTIKGTVNPKAKVVTDTEVITPFSVDAATGAFTITVQLPVEYKIYPVTLTVKNAGEQDTSIVLQIERIVNEVAYRTSAVNISYANLIATPDQYIGKITSFVGRIQKVTQMEKSVQFILEIDYLTNQPLYVKYVGDTTIVVGKKLKLVGEITDMQEGKPAMLARLAYKINP